MPKPRSSSPVEHNPWADPDDSTDAVAETRPPTLEYGTPRKTGRSDDSNELNLFFLRAVRRLIFMAGMAIIFDGLGSLLPGTGATESLVAGAVLIGFCIPLGPLPWEPRP